MDIVYVVGPSRTHDDLRHSLRTVATHVPHDNIFISGDIPAWTRNIIPLPSPERQHRGRHIEAAANLYRACKDKRVSETFALFNDDMFAMQTIGQLENYHFGAIKKVLKLYEQTNSKYTRNMHKTFELCQTLQTPTLFSYELHVPFVGEKTRWLKILDMQQQHLTDIPRLQIRTLYGNYYQVEAKQIDDTKIYGKKDPGPPNTTWLSTDARTWDHAAGDRIRAAFPEPCIYERNTR